MSRVAFIRVKHGERGYGFFGVGIDLNGDLEFTLCFLKVVVQPIEAAQQQVIVHASGSSFTICSY